MVVRVWGGSSLNLREGNFLDLWAPSLKSEVVPIVGVGSKIVNLV